MSDARKPLAALLIEEKGGAAKGKSEPPADDVGGDEETMAAEDAASAMGAKDVPGAAQALIDAIRACIAKSRKGGYTK